MKIAYIQYRYSPENLEIYLNNKLLNKKYYSNLGYEFYQSENKIKFIREKILFKNDLTNKKLVTISFLHSEESLKWLDKNYSGYISTYKEILEFKREITKKHNKADIIKIEFKKLK